MNLITWNVVRHLLFQIGTVMAIAGVAKLTSVDYSSLGTYAVYAQMIAAFVASIVNEALGTAPKK